MSINAGDTKVSILFSLLLARTSILSCFSYLFLVILSNFLIISVKENKKVKLALATPTGAPITIVKEIIDTPPMLQTKQLKFYLCNQMQLHIYLHLYCSTFFL